MLLGDADMSKSSWMSLDEFVSATNVARYERMLAASTDEAERETIRRLLAEETTHGRHHSPQTSRRGGRGPGAVPEAS